MSKVTFRRWVVKFVECCICMVIIALGCIGVASIMGVCLKVLGVG